MWNLQAGRQNVLILRCCAVLVLYLAEVGYPNRPRQPASDETFHLRQERARNETKSTTTGAFNNAINSVT